MAEPRKHKQTRLTSYCVKVKRRKESDKDLQNVQRTGNPQPAVNTIIADNRNTESENDEEDIEGDKSELSGHLQGCEDEHLGMTSEQESFIENTIQTDTIATNIQDNIGEGIDPQETDNINHQTLNVRMAVYKLANDRIEGLDTIHEGIQALLDCIKVALEKNENIRHVKSKKDPIHVLSFYVTHFFFLTESEINRPATQITSQMNNQEKDEHFPGPRDSGNILVYYRFKNHVPEIFCLCHNNAYHAIIHLSDPIFRSKIVQLYMNDYNIKELETINIAGPDIMTKTTYRDGISIATQTSAYLEKAISSVSGIIDTNSKLQQVIQKGDKRSVQLKVGMNFIRISTILTYERWAEVLDLFSDDVEKDITRSPCHIVDALEYVTRVDDRQKAKSLSEKLSKRVKHIISENKPIEDLYLSHRYIRDFILAPLVKLLEVNVVGGKRNTPTVIEYWNHTPTLADVIEKIQEFYSLPETVKKKLDSDEIVLSYPRNGKQEKHPVQGFVHGTVPQDGGAYYKIGQKWYFLSSAYSEVIDKNFALFSKSGILLDEYGKVSNILPYPWNTGTSRSFKIEDVERYFDVSTDDAAKLLEILTSKENFIDTKGCCTLTEISCLLPKFSELFNDLKSVKDKAKRKRRKPNIDNSNTSNSKITTFLPRASGPNAASGSHVDNSADMSATVESDTESVSENEPECINRDSGDKSDKGTNRQSPQIHSILFKLVRHKHTVIDSETELCLKKQRSICTQGKSIYHVKNPVLTEEILNRVRDSVMALKDVPETKILKFLRFVSPLTEGEYNELYLHYDEHKHLISIPGDRILANDIELFDILIYDESHRKTYLFHCKEKFGNHTRDACAQIRNSSELLWHDFLRGKTTHIEHFWNHAIDSKSTEPYRILLKEHLKTIGKDRFMKMFSEEANIVFVYAYSHSDGSNHLKLDFKPITPNDFAEILNTSKEECEKVIKSLREAGFLNSKGYLEDVFIKTTKDKFVKECRGNDVLKTLKTTQLNQIYDTLKKFGRCELSTIAKLELLTLDSCFARYQIGGKKHFELKFVQIKSKY